MNIVLPENVTRVTNMLKNHQGKCYIVGGFVRDYILNIESLDFDIEVHGIEEERLYTLLEEVDDITIIKKFGVIKYQNIELALPRTEEKSGNTHTDFKVIKYKNLELCKAIQRRDFTINTLMYDVNGRILIDSLNAIEDLNNKVLKHITPNFRDDPLRLLRAIRFSSNIGFTIDEDTLKICYSMKESLKYLSNERIEKEFILFMSGKHLSVGIKYVNLLFSFYNLKIEDRMYDIITASDSLNTRLILLFSNLDIAEEVLSILVKNKKLRKFIKSINSINVFNLEDRFKIYYSGEFKQFITYMYRMYSINIREEIKLFKQLLSKYNGNVISSIVDDKRMIKQTQEKLIIKELKEKINENIFRCR